MASALRIFLQERMVAGASCVDDLSFDEFAIACGMWGQENRSDLQCTLAEIAKVHLADRLIDHFMATGQHRMTRLNADLAITGLTLPWIRNRLETEWMLAKFLANHPPEAACQP